MAAASAAAASAAAAGLSTAAIAAVVVALIGVEPRAIAWAMVGGVFGAPLAPQAGRVRQVLVFAASTAVCALGGTAAAMRWHGADPLWRDVWSASLAVIFHPATATVVKLVPEVISGLAARFVDRNRDRKE